MKQNLTLTQTLILTYVTGYSSRIVGYKTTLRRKGIRYIAVEEIDRQLFPHGLACMFFN
jgi:hypothetical protein